MKKGSEGFGHENLIPTDIPSTWKAMETLYDSGKARAIGVSNFSTKKLGDLLQYARIPPAANQVECHPSWHQTKLREFCKSKGIHLSVRPYMILWVIFVKIWMIKSCLKFHILGLFSARIPRHDMA